MVTGPNFGIRIFSTPSSLSLTWKVESPAATRSISMARPAYSLPSTVTIKGTRRLTPSTSGSVFTIPTPAAAFSNDGMLAINPGYCTIRSNHSGPSIALPEILGVFFVCSLGTDPSTTGYCFKAAASTASPPVRSCSAMRMLSTTRPAPRSYKSLIIFAYSVLGNGH